MQTEVMPKGNEEVSEDMKAHVSEADAAQEGEVNTPLIDTSEFEKKLEEVKEEVAKLDEKLGSKPEAAPIGKASFAEDKLLVNGEQCVDIVELVYCAISGRQCHFPDMPQDERECLLTLVRNVLSHRQPTPSLVQNLINKIFKVEDAKSLTTMEPSEQRVAYLVYGIVLAFKKVD